MNARKVLFYLIAVALGGCVPVMSVYPLYGEKDVIIDENLLGSWTGDPDQPREKWLFERFGDEATNEEHARAYRLTLTDRQGKGGVFQVRLVKLKDRLLMDIYPDTDSLESALSELPYDSVLFAPVHTFALIELSESKLRIRITNVDEFKKLLAENPDAIAYRQSKDRILLTAPTKKLQKFVLDHVDDERLFCGDIKLSRKN